MSDVSDPISDILSRNYGSHQRPVEMLRLFAEMGGHDGRRFWRLVASEWDGFDAIPHAEYGRLFRRYREAWSPDVMEPDDRVFFDALAPTLTVYRGQDASAHVGLSWTLDRGVADEFAGGHRGILNAAPVVLEARIRKPSVALALASREESELVLFRPPNWRLAAG